MRFPPPLIFVAAIALGAGMHWLWPVSARPPAWGPLGGIFALFAIGLFLWAGLTLHRQETSTEPWRSTKLVVTSGPFGLSRNPIYLSLALFQVGLGLWHDRFAIALMVIPAVALAAARHFTSAVAQGFFAPSAPPMSRRTAFPARRISQTANPSMITAAIAPT